MQSLASVFAGIVLAAFSAHAQDPKLTRDVTYSTHNYKHANKAAEAARWERRSASAPVTPNVVASAPNYKQPVPGVTAPASLVVPSSGPASLASRNYKASPVAAASQRSVAQQPTKSATTSGD